MLEARDVQDRARTHGLFDVDLIPESNHRGCHDETSNLQRSGRDLHPRETNEI